MLCRRWLLLDIDAVRPGGISSTDYELEAAKTVLDSVTTFLAGQRWPEPITAMSGNGYYAIYAINLPNDQASLELAKRVLSGLAARFHNDRARVDSAVANASRLVGLVGTRKVKGDSTKERPHRRSCLVHVPERFLPASLELLESVASLAPNPEKIRGGVGASGSPMRLDELLRRHGIEYREQPPDAAGITWYHVRQCPFHSDGRSFECGVGQLLPDGPLAGKCFHPEGDRMGWQEWKAALGIDGAPAKKGAKEKAMTRATEVEITVEQVPTDYLFPDPANPRRISNRELESLTRSLHEFGFVQPVLARKSDNVIIGGHRHLVAARRLGWKTVPVIFLDLSVEKSRLLNLALNKISGEWDQELLARMLADLKPIADIDLSLSGFSEEELGKLLKSLDLREKKERVESL